MEEDKKAEVTNESERQSRRTRNLGAIVVGVAQTLPNGWRAIVPVSGTVNFKDAREAEKWATDHAAQNSYADEYIVLRIVKAVRFQQRTVTDTIGADIDNASTFYAAFSPTEATVDE